MNIYLLSQDENSGYDTYDAIVVCAENKDDAKTILPSGATFTDDHVYTSSWATKLENIQCDELGEANESQQRGVILASFNAG